MVRGCLGRVLIARGDAEEKEQTRSLLGGEGEILSPARQGRADSIAIRRPAQRGQQTTIGSDAVPRTSGMDLQPPLNAHPQVVRTSSRFCAPDRDLPRSSSFWLPRKQAGLADVLFASTAIDTPSCLIVHAAARVWTLAEEARWRDLAVATVILTLTEVHPLFVLAGGAVAAVVAS